MPPTKRRKLSDDEEEEVHDSADESGLDGASEAESSEHSLSDGDETDTEDELEGLKRKKSKKTSKRKLRATGASTFGAALQSLLSTDAPSAAPLSLKPSIARKRNDQKLELKAKKVLQIEKKEKEDKRRIKDPIGGWGGESERALRKVAQRGGTRCAHLIDAHISNVFSVVKLFNAIQQSQATVAAAAEEAKGERGTGKPRLPAPVVETKGKKKGKKKDNIIGRGKESEYFH
jgi:hypothetical protein